MMKKAVCTLLILSALLSLSGCSEFQPWESGQESETKKKSTRLTLLTKDPFHEYPIATEKTEVTDPSTHPPVTDDPITEDKPNPGAAFTEVPDFSSEGATILSFKEHLPDEIASYVNHYKPDVFTLSDSSLSVIKTLTEGLSDYAPIGIPSHEDDGEIQSIFYRTDRFDVIKSATIWLSDTPSKPSKWSGADAFHTCTYALFADKDSSDCFAVFNTSLDESPSVREKEIFSLYQKYSCYKDYFPTVVTGDLKLDRKDDPGYGTLTDGGGLTFVADNLFSVSMEKSFVGTVCKDHQEGGSLGQLVYGKTPYKLDLSKKRIALTFDDGPRMDSIDHAYTDAVLEALSNHACKATFFVVGERLKSKGQAELLKQEFAAGHQIGNHTYSHIFYNKLSESDLLDDLAKTDDLVRSLTGGIPTTLLRAPGGSNKTKAKLTLPLVNWSLDTEDWNTSAGVTPAMVLATVKKELKEGDIILMHDLRKNSPTILGELLDWMTDNNYQPVTVSELYEFSDIQMDSGMVYYSTSKIKDRP